MNNKSCKVYVDGEFQLTISFNDTADKNLYSAFKIYDNFGFLFNQYSFKGALPYTFISTTKFRAVNNAV
jgi:hypothetical protein